MSVQINVSGNHLDVTSALKEHAEKQLSKLNKKFDHIIKIDAVLSIDSGNQHKAEANVSLAGSKEYFFADAKSDDMYNSINLLTKKLETQVVKHKEKLKDHGHGDLI